MSKLQSLFAAILLSAPLVLAQQAQQGQQAQQPPAPMTFFVTSAGPGNGANLGGLAGADAHCQKLAAAVGAGSRTWRAYLSTQASGGQASVNARDRIGRGPWHNAKGEQIAPNVADLHGDVQRDRINLHKATAVSEKGEVVNGRGDQPNRHDILTGSDSLGNAFADSADHTCQNWTSGTAGAGSAQLGHHDRQGGSNTSWNSAHGSRGCSQDNLRATGGDGLLYCFAAQ
ncbi:MAG TPA: hypothetical protein VF982_02185 [Anaerolineales bacterium]